MHRARRVAGTLLALACAACQAAQPAPRVVRVQPSGSEIPANLLRLSIGFSAPVEGPVLRRIALLRIGAGRVQEPFLEQELWSPSGKALTVLMHPARVKHGLNARDEKGPILSVGDEVVLTLDGAPIKRWRVGPADEMGPVASAWKVQAVQAASTQPLVVLLDAPIDGRDADYLAIADARGHRVAGRGELMNGENTWAFTPDRPWQAGAYRLMVRGTLEDPAGNRLGDRFETSIDSPPSHPADAALAFTVAALKSRR